MCEKIINYGNAIGELIAKHRNEYLILLATLVMFGGYVFSGFMYADMKEFMAAQTQAQIATANTLAEMNVRLAELELEHKQQRANNSK